MEQQKTKRQVEAEELKKRESIKQLQAERQAIEKKFAELKKHYTIILVTHTLRQARRIADYVIFMYLGEIIEQGPAEQIFRKPKEKKTQAYIEGSFIN